MKQNSINELPLINSNRYENLFNIFTTTKNNNYYYYYNILSKITIPDTTSNTVYQLYKVDKLLPLTTISYNIYNTIHLWWLIVTINKIQNPVKLIAPGSILKILRQEYINNVINKLK